MDRSIAWAVDVFQTEREIFRSAVETLAWIATGLGLKIQPVFVLTGEEIHLDPEYGNTSSPRQALGYQKAAKRMLSERLREDCSDELKARLLDPVVLAVDSTSPHSTTEALCSFAEGTGIEAILVSTHGRGKMARLFLGSFTEHLLKHSKIPVVVVHPRAETEHRGPVVIPTDLSDSSRSILEEGFALAQSLGLRVHLLHCLELPAEPVVQSAAYLLGGGWIAMDSYMTDEIAERQKRLEDCVRLAQDFGLQATAQIEHRGGALVDGILRVAAHEKASLIVTTPLSGLLLSTFLGNVAWEIARLARCPVWISRVPGVSRILRSAA